VAKIYLFYLSALVSLWLLSAKKRSFFSQKRYFSTPFLAQFLKITQISKNPALSADKNHHNPFIHVA